MSEFDYSFKCVLLGDSGVGKTCLLQRLKSEKNPLSAVPTVEGVFHKHSVKVEDMRIHLSIWDTAGQETFKSVTRIYYRGASCAMLVYDITRRASFESLPGWIRDLSEISKNKSIVMTIIANKCDMESRRQVRREEGEALARRYNIDYIETSAKTGENLKKPFNTLSQAVFENIKSGRIVPEAEMNGIKLGERLTQNPTSKEKKASCGC